MAPIALLLRTVFEAILEVFLLCLAGYFLAWKDVLDKRTQKQLNRLNVSLFTPALLFSKVAFSLSPEKLRELWSIPIFFVVVTVVSMTIAYILGVTFRLKRSQRNFAMAAAMFMNSNSLPIALMQSLVVTVPILKWDEDDTESAMLGRALSYLVLYSTLGMVLRWSYGVRLLQQADPESSPSSEPTPLFEPYTDHPEHSILVQNDDTSPRTDTLPSNDSQPSITFDEYTHRGVRQDSTDSTSNTLAVPHKRPRPKDFMSFPNTPISSTINLKSDSNASGSPSATLVTDDDHCAHSSDSESDSDAEPLLVRTRHDQAHVASRKLALSYKYKRFLRHAWKRFRRGAASFNEFMTVPLWAALLSIIVALTPPLQHTLDVHLQPIKGALTASGNCSIPLTLVVLGAYFYRAPEKTPQQFETRVGPEDSRRDESRTSGRSASFAGSVRGMFRLSRLDRWEAQSKKKETRPGETRTVVIAVLSRMIIAPLLLLPLMALGAKYNFPKVFDDPVFIVSNILLISSPPALTLAQITQAASGDAFERLISRTIFWAYCILTPPFTIIYVVIGLYFAKL